MKHWISFILLLVISCSQKGHACYFYPYGEDIRFSIFNPDNFKYNGFRIYNYTSNYYYKENYTTLQNTITENDLMWLNHCKKQISILEIKNAVFEIPLVEFNSTSTNSFVKYLFRNNDYEAIEYLKFAKQTETLMPDGEDLWENNTDKKDNLRNAKIELAFERIKSSKNKTLAKRYYYQVFKLLSYMPNTVDRTIKLYEEYSKKYKTQDFLDNWALFYRMTVEKNDVRMNYLASQVFARGTDNKFEIRWYFNRNIPIEQVLKYAQSNEEKANVYVLYSFKKTDQNLDTIKKVFELDSKNEGLSFLLLREINKLEDWILTPTYTMYLPVLREDYWENSNETRILNRVEVDRKYASEVLHFINRIDLNKVEDKNFFLLSKSYLEFLTKNSEGALKTIASFEGDIKDDKFKRQVNIIKALCLTANQEINKAEIVEVTKNIILNEYRNNNNESFVFAIAKELEFLGNKTDASFLISQFKDNYEEKQMYWKSRTGKVSLRDDFYYDWYGYVDAELSSSEMQNLVNVLSSKSKSNFDVWKKGVLLQNKDKVNDLLGIKYMRDDNLKMAYLYFSKMNKEYYTNKLFNENPFYKIKGYIDFDKKQTSLNFTKASVTFSLMNYLNKAETPNAKDRDLNYFLAGNCYYNMTYYGNSWMMKRIMFTSDHRESKLQDDDQYYTCKKAKELYQKAFENSKSEKFKALCMFMISKCNAQNNEYLAYKDVERYYYLEEKQLVALNKKSFGAFKAKYPKEYKEMTSNCELFGVYFKSR